MKIEIRSSNEAVISGYVNAVMRNSKKMRKGIGSDTFVERVRDGTFAHALQTDKAIELRYNHERKLCDTHTGLELKEDNIGLYASAVITDSEVIEKAKNHELRGWSFGFICNKDSWDKDGETERRTLEDINLLEVSILTKAPAYFGTSASFEMRGEESEIIEMRGSDDIEVKNMCKNENAESLQRMKIEVELMKIKGGF